MKTVRDRKGTVKDRKGTEKDRKKQKMAGKDS